MSTAPQITSTSCILDASAGTGKTTQLVKRIVAAMASGVLPENIVAVTFTNAAAGEMKLRVRQKLEEAGLADALAGFERAFIGTIHAFCAHLIRQRPVEACVDPAFQLEAIEQNGFEILFDFDRLPLA